MSEDIKNSIINLDLGRNIKTLVIGGIKFELDIDDPEVFKALLEFKEEHTEHYAAVETDVDGLLEDCHHVIETCLGEGACDKLFRKKDMKMYLLVNELAKIYLDNFMKEEREEAEIRSKKELENIKEIISGMTQFTQMMNYANNKYGKQGMKNYVRSKKPSKKNKHRGK